MNITATLHYNGRAMQVHACTVQICTSKIFIYRLPFSLKTHAGSAKAAIGKYTHIAVLRVQHSLIPSLSHLITCTVCIYMPEPTQLLAPRVAISLNLVWPWKL